MLSDPMDDPASSCGGNMEGAVSYMVEILDGGGGIDALAAVLRCFD